jgi:hypothetical protein
MTPWLAELLGVVRSDPGALDEALRARRADVTPELAKEAHQAWKDNIRAGRVNDALDAALVARTAYVVLGLQRESLAVHIDLAQSMFMAAQTPDEYSSTRDMALASVELAEQIDAHDLAFRAASIAADCSYWAADALGQDERAREWLLTALDDVLSAADRVATTDPAAFGIFVSLLTAVAERCMETFWPSGRQQREAEGGLRALAAAADRLVPPDFEFAGDQSRTDRIASSLARLSTAYGG